MTGSTEGDARVDVTGGASAASTTAESTGRFRVSVTLNRNQTNTLSVRATGGGGQGPAAQVTVTHDDIAPAAPAIVAPAFTNSSPVTVTGTAEAGATVRVTTGAGSAQGAAGSSGEFSIQVPLTENAANTISAVATDRAGNQGTAGTANTVHDGIAPAVEFTDPADGSTTPAPPAGFLIALAYSDGGSGVVTDSLEVAADRDLVGLLQQDGSKPVDRPAGSDLTDLFSVAGDGATWNVDGTRFAFLAGANALSGSIYDLAGNVSDPALVSFTATTPDANLIVIDSEVDPGSAGHGIPIGLTDLRDLGGVNLTLNFDPAVLTVDSVRTTGRVGFPAFDNADTEGTSGAVDIVVLDVGGDPIPAGSDVIFHVFATVDAAAPSGDSPITLTELAASDTLGTSIPITATDGSVTIR